jgi:hypothetical protein
VRWLITPVKDHSVLLVRSPLFFIDIGLYLSFLAWFFVYNFNEALIALITNEWIKGRNHLVVLFLAQIAEILSLYKPV